jgi:hypothetical protein
MQSRNLHASLQHIDRTHHELLLAKVGLDVPKQSKSPRACAPGLQCGRTSVNAFEETRRRRRQRFLGVALVCLLYSNPQNVQVIDKRADK